MGSERSSISERSHLLSSDGTAAASDGCSHPPSPRTNDGGNRERGTASRIKIAVLCLALFLVIEFAATILAICISQIQEGVICQGFYPDVEDTKTDPRCKDDRVQSELSTIQGWGFTFAIIPGIITAVPYGVAADKYGRRIILSLSLLGTFLVEALGMIICELGLRVLRKERSVQ